MSFVTQKLLTRLPVSWRSMMSATFAVPSQVRKESASVNIAEERKLFDSAYQEIEKSLLPEHDPLLGDVSSWLKGVLNFNVPVGKKNRGVATVLSFKLLANSNKLTEDDVRLARILGWSIEMLQAFFLIEDDVVDQSTTRRGKQCWFRKKEVGLSAINDGCMIYFSIYKLLNKHFSQKPYYIDMVELMSDIALKTSYGQCLDVMSAGRKEKFNIFTEERYAAIVKYKTAFYSFYLPVAAALVMAEYKEKGIYDQAENILLKMGHFFQVQDDYLDAFGDPEVIGKNGSDISEGKCSWLIMKSLQLASAKQREILKENYGYKESEKIECVKGVFKELNMEKEFECYEVQTYNNLLNQIQQVGHYNLSQVLLQVLNFIYQRKH